MTSAEVHFEQICSAIEGAKVSSMFGLKCGKLGRKPFAMLYEDQIACYLFDAVKEEALKLEGAQLFNPKKNIRPMSNWVQISYAHADEWSYFATLAFHFTKDE